MTPRCPCCHQPLRKTVEDACREALDRGERLPSLTRLQPLDGSPGPARPHSDAVMPAMRGRLHEQIGLDVAAWCDYFRRERGRLPSLSELQAVTGYSRATVIRRRRAYCAAAGLPLPGRRQR